MSLNTSSSSINDLNSVCSGLRGALAGPWHSGQLSGDGPTIEERYPHESRTRNHLPRCRAARPRAVPKEELGRTFEEYLDMVRANPRLTRNAFERVYDMIRSYGTETYEENREKQDPLSLFQRSRRRRARRRIRLGRFAGLAGQCLQKRGPGLRHRETRVAAARPGGQQQEHDRPNAEKGAGAVRRHRRRGHVHVGLVGRRQRAVVPDERGAAAPGARAVPRRSGRQSQCRSFGRRVHVRIHGELCPFCRYVYTDLRKQYGGDWTGWCRTCASSG